MNWCTDFLYFSLAPGHNSNVGRVYVVYGSSSPSSTVLGGGLIFTGVAGDYFGRALATGDVNADGYDDILIGAPYYSSSTGKAYLIYGGLTLSSLTVSSMTLTDGIYMTGINTQDYTGFSLTIGSDLNGDAIPDMLIGAMQYTSFTGCVYAVYGGKSLSNMALGSMTVSQGFQLVGSATNEYAGRNLAIGGDLNMDGKADLAIGGIFF
jgi:hypothetical protein